MMFWTAARPRAVLLAALAYVLAACTQQGRLVVEVDSNIEDLDVVTMRVRRSTVAEGESNDFALSRNPLPLRLGVEPVGGIGLVRIEAVGLRGGAAVVESTATINVVPGPTRMWRMYLDARCEGVLDCADDETCVGGVCRLAPVIESQDLPGLNELDAAPDARAADASDAGLTETDAGPGPSGTVCVAEMTVTTGGGQPSLSVSPGATNLGLSWTWRAPSDRKVCPYFTSLDPTGVRTLPETRLADVGSGAAALVRLATSETGNHVVTWTNASGTPGSLVPVGPSGLVEPTLALASAFDTVPIAVVSAGGSTFGVAWSDARDGTAEVFYGRFLAGSGVLGAEHQISLSDGTAAYPALVWTGSGYGVAWSDLLDATNQEIYFAQLDTSGARIGEIVRVTDAPGLSAAPSLAWSGSEFGLVWWDTRAGDRRLLFTRLDAAGVELESAREISAGPDDDEPILVWGSTDFAVAWNDGTTIRFTRIDTTGAPFGEPLTLGTGRAPSIVYTEGAFSVAWEHSTLPGVRYARVCP